MYYNAFSADLYLPSACKGTWRFRYSGEWDKLRKSGWISEYQVKEVPLTAAQLAALNSGITSSAVSDITANTTARHTHSNMAILNCISFIDETVEE